MGRRRSVVVALVLTASLVVFEVRRDDRVGVRGLPWLQLPVVCPLRAATGVSCPACGLTRAMLHLGRGEFRASWRSNKLGTPLGLILVAYGARRLLTLRGRAR